MNGCSVKMAVDFIFGQGRTIPISSASSEPAILHTSVEQNPQVSRTCRNALFLLIQAPDG